MWDVEFTDEFGSWWATLGETEQDAIDVAVHLLEEEGPHLGFPYSSGVHGSRHSHMRELRVQTSGRPYRILYAFDPRRVAILLVGGEKGVMTAGTTGSFVWPTGFTTSTWKNFVTRD